MSYNPAQIEPKWQAEWEKAQLFQHAEGQTKVTPENKKYLLFAFAYPSGSGLHVGHVESKTALDMLSRFYRMNGQKVFFPVGWDAFGLPAENYAIKTGIPPAVTTKDAINTFRRQIKRLGISYDWSNETATNHPEYYKWTQWLFLQMYKKGLAYRSTGMVNWCPSCQTVLANEQVVDGKCERCGTKVIQKELEQWYYRITKYTEELISGLNKVDWPRPTKEQQLHWIGKKEGIQISYPVDGMDEEITCFTTRPETNFGATFLVLAPEHPFVKKILEKKPNKEIADYVRKTAEKTELDRQTEGKKKTGVWTGYYVTNRLNGQKLPVWISDFVLSGFGTGAVVGVPAHDERDLQFAQAMQLPVVQVINDAGQMINSQFLDGLDIPEATHKMMDYLEEKGWGRRVINYKLRDWLISRQRYWGVPIPIVYDPQGKPHPVKEEHLPWLLPTDVDFKPTGESPLKSSKEFFARTEKLYGKGWKPECDTMDTFVDSSWYFLRYVDSRNPKKFASQDQIKKWLPVDLYLIGPEHIVLHLLYARFFTKFLRDEGYLNFDEPFLKMRHQGMILGPDGKKMSKSKGNVINPDSVVEKYGADTLRMYEMFMGPLEADKPWDTGSVIGIYRFLQRIYDLATASDKRPSQSDPDLQRVLHRTIQKITADLPALKFNTAISALMILVNKWEKTAMSLADTQIFVRLLAPFAPFLAEELNTTSESIHLADWPKFDPKLAQETSVTIAVQINGKVRADFQIPAGEINNQAEIVQQAQQLPVIQKWLSRGDSRIAPTKVIYIPGRVVNLVL